MAPEALAFGVVGATTTVLYMAITAVALPIGAVKANIIATVVTATLAYLANQAWTYRHCARGVLHREVLLFFSFNLVGMAIQAGSVAISKYAFGLTEEDDEFAFMAVTLCALVAAAVFRFWAYRTFIFLKPSMPDAGLPSA